MGVREARRYVFCLFTLLPLICTAVGMPFSVLADRVPASSLLSLPSLRLYALPLRHASWSCVLVLRVPPVSTPTHARLPPARTTGPRNSWLGVASVPGLLLGETNRSTSRELCKTRQTYRMVWSKIHTLFALTFLSSGDLLFVRKVLHHRRILNELEPRRVEGEVVLLSISVWIADGDGGL